MTIRPAIGRPQRRARFLALLVACAAFAAMSVASPAGAQVPARLVLQDGQTPPGAPAPVSTIGPPFVSGTGKVGFTGSLEDGDRYVWHGDGIRWLNSSGSGLSGAEIWMGTSDANGFIYSPEVNGGDGVYTHGGALLVEDDPAPGFPAGVVNTFNSRPSMLPGGRVYWVAGINETGGTVTQKRVLYTSADATPTAIERLLVGGDTVAGLVIADQGVLFDYRFSDDGAHHMHELDVIAPSTSNVALMVDGQIVAREGFPTPDGVELWSTFDQLGINNAGNYVFSGDTNNDTAKDEFVAYNGAVAVRETQTVAGVTLASGATANAVHINDLDQVVMIWDVGDTETLFFSCEADDIAGTASVVLATGRELDLDGNGTSDAVVTDFNATASTPHEAFSDDGRLYLEVDLDHGDGNELESVIELKLSCCGNGVVNSHEECDDAGESATCDNDCTAATCGDGVTNVTAGEECDDAGESAACDADCTAAACGDGVTNATAGEECDDAGESASCDADCTTAACGDGVTNATAGEECDDAGESAACNADCTVAGCGDGVTNTVAGEECDDAGESATCDADCSAAACGDGETNAVAGETCDDAGASAACDADCTAVDCGDGAVNAEAGEECDAGGESAACDADCTAATCGDGTRNAAAGEECDDGNTAGGDACSSSCQVVEPGEPGEPSDPREPDEGCACSAGDGRSAPVTTGLLLGVAWLALRRRRRRDQPRS